MTALLGVVIGVLATLLVSDVVRGRHTVRVGDRSWEKLNVILGQVEQNYVDSVDHNAVTEAAVSAALSSLDPHSVYLPPVELKEADTDLASNFEGIGIQFNVPSDTAVVLEVIPGGPSEKAGLRKGDRILKVDTTVIAGRKFPQDSMVRRMKGPSGTKVAILVERDGQKVPFEITRGKIPLHSIDASFMIDDSTAYVRLSKFSRSTFSESLSALSSLSKQGMRRLVFDVRGNAGGYMDQALLLSNLFLPAKAGIVYLEGRHRKRDDYYADGKGPFKDLSLAVLIDQNSASSSEIFAGAMQDNDRGIVVGRRSFGKGLVQEPVYFSDGSGIRLTVSRFYTPSGRCIQKPYSSDYQYDLYKRYSGGEFFAADSIKIDSSKVYHTVGGRTVYGGGGIVPDVFVPMDTTRATKFFIECDRKATSMRYAAYIFDRFKYSLSPIDSYPALERFLEGLNIPVTFRDFALRKDGIKATDEEWEKSAPYMLPQIRALVGRYSALGENVFYKLYLPVDEVVKAAMKALGTTAEQGAPESATGR